MADVNPRGPVVPTTGKTEQLDPGDVLITSTNAYIGATGAFGVSGLRGATGLQSATAGATGISVRGETGFHGQTGVQGSTGIKGLLGTTGTFGVTGVQVRGSTGVLGVTGLIGVTGLVGQTGVIGPQGYTGVSDGYTGLAGSTGLIGHTGIQGTTGVGVQGLTGLHGNTGLLGITGLPGNTGVGLIGVSPQGMTGIAGATGLLDLLTLDVQRQTTGVTLLYAVPSTAINTTGQELEFFCSGLSATSGAATTLFIEFGGYPLFSDTITFAGGSDLMVNGIIKRVGSAAQETWIRAVYEAGDGLSSWQSINANLAITNNLIVSLSSAGTGHILYSLIIRRIEEASDSV